MSERNGYHDNEREESRGAAGAPDVIVRGWGYPTPSQQAVMNGKWLYRYPGHSLTTTPQGQP